LSEEEIFKIKTLALLHDPPWKPWVITSSIKGIKGGEVLKEIVGEFGVSYYDRSEDVHEKEGFTFARLLGIKENEIEEYKEIVHEADKFSASVERYALEAIGGDSESGVVKQERKYNVFNVNHKIQLKKEIDKECIEKYVRWIVNNIGNLGWREKYHALYALIEVAWYHFCPDHYPLADTRVGTYSVFDHLYATASMANWFLNVEPLGLLG